MQRGLFTSFDRKDGFDSDEQMEMEEEEVIAKGLTRQQLRQQKRQDRAMLGNLIPKLSEKTYERKWERFQQWRKHTKQHYYTACLSF